MTTTDPGSDKAVQAWYALYRRAINEANGLTNYVEDRPELRSAEKRIARIEEEARALTSAPQAQPTLPEKETPEMHDAVMDVLYRTGGIPRTRTNELWQAYRSVLVKAAPPAQQQSEPLPEIDYTALIHAAAKIGHAQGTRGCIAFKHGAEWFRSTLAATPPSLQEPQEVCIQPCSGCPTPFRCKDTSGCAAAGRIVPTYYVHHPDDSYTAADPQPVLRA